LEEVSVGSINMVEKKMVQNVKVGNDGKVEQEARIGNAAEICKQVEIGYRKEQVKEVQKAIDEREINDDIDNENEEKETLIDPLEGELEFVSQFLAHKLTKDEIIEKEVKTKHKEKRKTNYKNEQKKVKFTKQTKERVSVIDGGEVILNEKGDSMGMKRGEDNIWRKIKDTNNNDKNNEIDKDEKQSGKLNSEQRSVQVTETVEDQERV
jgi:hypothetical protein